MHLMKLRPIIHTADQQSHYNITSMSVKTVCQNQVEIKARYIHFLIVHAVETESFSLASDDNDVSPISAAA